MDTTCACDEIGGGLGFEAVVVIDAVFFESPFWPFVVFEPVIHFSYCFSSCFCVIQPGGHIPNFNTQKWPPLCFNTIWIYFVPLTSSSIYLWTHSSQVTPRGLTIPYKSFFVCISVVNSDLTKNYWILHFWTIWPKNVPSTVQLNWRAGLRGFFALGSVADFVLYSASWKVAYLKIRLFLKCWKRKNSWMF